MRRDRPCAAAVEGVVTRHGTLVGPMMTELAGFPELTPYKGGWCGNDAARRAAAEGAADRRARPDAAMGDRLRQEGYSGYFELDFLIDADTARSIWARSTRASAAPAR